MKDSMPLVEALNNYINEDTAPFHMPGHKMGRGFSDSFTQNIIKMDVTEIPGTDNLHSPEGTILEAEKLAAGAFGAERSFFLVNGSTSGIYSMLMSVLSPGSSMIIPRNCHKSVWGAMILGDIRPVYIEAVYRSEQNIATQVSPSAVQAALCKNPHVKGIILVHPNYYGMCCHMDKIEKMIHEHGKILLVDEAHGAHFNFHPDLPPSSGTIGADAWVQSAHKTLPAFTQSAFLHTKGNRMDISRLQDLLRLTQSTSPSYMLMASLDYARNFMETRGHGRISTLIEKIESIKRYIIKNTGLKILDTHKWDEVRWNDKTRLVIDVTSLGITGYDAERRLRKAGVQAEMSDHDRVVFICTVCDDDTTLDRLKNACLSLWNDTKANNKKEMEKQFIHSFNIPEQILSPREAFYSIIENVPLKECAGRVCAGMVGAYPPGIPRFCPGELIDKQGIEELTATQACGGTLFGISGEKNLVPVVKRL